MPSSRHQCRFQEGQRKQQGGVSRSETVPGYSKHAPQWKPKPFVFDNEWDSADIENDSIPGFRK